jgi:hypothetical protein
MFPIRYRKDVWTALHIVDYLERYAEDGHHLRSGRARLHLPLSRPRQLVESHVRRRSPGVDDDGLSVIVPRTDKALVPMSAARVRRLRKHLVEMLGEAKALKKASAPYLPEPTGFAAKVARAACSLCRGWCCQNGGDDAFLDDQTMARVRRDRPQLGVQALVRIYVEQVPMLVYQDSCIFHGKRGCTLDRSLRADICNGYFCRGLGNYVKSGEMRAPTTVIAGKGDTRGLSAG